MKAVCERHGAMFIMDEVMSGMGRTGTLHAWEQEGVVPDLQTVAKGLGAGYAPIGALLVNDRIVKQLEHGTGGFQHSQTYQGHPVACAAALEVQKIVQEENLLANVQEMGLYLEDSLKRRLEGHKHVGDIRGRGLFWGVSPLPRRFFFLFDESPLTFLQTDRVCQRQSHESSISSRTQSRTDCTCSCSTRPFFIPYPQYWYGERTRWRHCSACSAVQCHSTGDRNDCGENCRSYRASSRSLTRSIDALIIMASMQTKLVRTCWERRCVCNNFARFHRSHTRILSFAGPYQTANQIKGANVAGEQSRPLYQPRQTRAPRLVCYNSISRPSSLHLHFHDMA